MTDEWLRQMRKRYAARLAREWGDEVGHTREWWREEAKRTKTDWSNLLRQRMRVQWWVKLGRPSWREFVKHGRKD